MVVAQVALIQAPGRPGTPVSGQHTDLDVATSAALGLWSCSKSKSNKLVRVCAHMCVCMYVYVHACVRAQEVACSSYA